MSGPNFHPIRTHVEFDDPRNEQVTLQRVTQLVTPHKAVVLGVFDIPQEGTRIEYLGFPWALSVLTGDVKKPIPQSVMQRLNAVEAALGTEFMWFIWAEELPPQGRPRFTVDHSLTESKAALPATYKQQKQYQHYLTAIKRAEEAWETEQRDPMLIGVTPTGPNRGVWVLLGRWFR